MLRVIPNEELGKMWLSECRGQTCLNYAEHEHLRRSQLGVAMRDVSMYDERWMIYDVSFPKKQPRAKPSFTR